MHGSQRLSDAALLLGLVAASSLACAADVAAPVPKVEAATVKPVATPPQPEVKPALPVLPVLLRHWDALDPALLIKQIRKDEPRKLQPFPAELHR